jgi:hypothetical protein
MNDLEYAAGRAYGRYLVTEAGIKLNPVLAKYLGEELANLEPAAKPPAPPVAEPVGGKAATGGDDIGKLASTMAVVQMVAPDAAEEIEIARDESWTLQDRLEELFRRNRCFHGWSYTRLGAFCEKSRQAASDAIKKSEILRACRIGEIDE